MIQGPNSLILNMPKPPTAQKTVETQDKTPASEKNMSNLNKGLLAIAGVGLLAAASINLKVSNQKIGELKKIFEQRLKNFDHAVDYLKTEGDILKEEALSKIFKLYEDAAEPMKGGGLKSLRQKLKNISSFEDAKNVLDDVNEFIFEKFGEYANDPMFQKLYDKAQKIVKETSEKLFEKRNQIISSFEKEANVSKETSGLLHDPRCFNAVMNFHNNMRANLEKQSGAFFQHSLDLENYNRSMMNNFLIKSSKLMNKSQELLKEAKEAVKIMDPQNTFIEDMFRNLNNRKN